MRHDNTIGSVKGGQDEIVTFSLLLTNKNDLGISQKLPIFFISISLFNRSLVLVATTAAEGSRLGIVVTRTFAFLITIAQKISPAFETDLRDCLGKW